MEFKEILKDLLLEKGLNQRKLSIQTDIPATTINGWLNLDRLPDYNSIIKLSNFFNVSTDFLFGKDNTFFDFNLKKEEKDTLKILNNLSNTNKIRWIAYGEGMLLGENKAILNENLKIEIKNKN